MAKSKNGAWKSAANVGSEASREAIIAAANALLTKEVRRPPSYVVAWLEWGDGLARIAAKDAGPLLLVPLLGGPLTVPELGRFAAGVALAQEYVKVAGVLRISAAATETDAERAMLWAVRGDQRRLDRALLLRFADDSAGRAFLTGLRRGDPTDPVDALDDTEKLLALADSDAHRVWLSALPKGEGAAVKRLHAALPGLRAAVARLAPSKDAAEKRELFRRGVTLLVASAARIGLAGRYLTGDVAGRERAYAAFKRPKAKKPRTKSTP